MKAEAARVAGGDIRSAWPTDLISACDLDLHLLLTVADSLAAATADLASLADVVDRSCVLVDVLALLDGLDWHAAVLELVISRHASQ